MSRAAARTELRIRAARLLDAMASQAVLSIVVATVTLAVAKVAPLYVSRVARAILWGALVSVPLSGLAAFSRRLPALIGAMLLDRAHGLEGRIANALWFSRTPADLRTPLVDLAIEDGAKHAHGLSPRRAYRIGAPRDAPAVIVLSALALFVASLETRTHRPVAVAVPTQPVLLDADDLDLFREVGRTLGERAKDPEMIALAAEYNSLVFDLAHRRLDRIEALRRMSDLESRIANGRALDPKKLEQELERRARALKKSELLRPSAEALEAQDFAKAAKALVDLANKLSKGELAQKKAELERLREAMKKASEERMQRLAALDKRRDELRERLLSRKADRGDAGAPDEEEKRLLDRRERELERLDRELDEERTGGRSLDRLDRDLARAAEDILRELGLSAKDLEQAAEDVNRMAEEKMTDEQREELRQRLEDLREQLRQAGQNGTSRMVQMSRFLRLARGQRGSGGGDKAQGEDQGEGDGKKQGQGREGDGQGDSVLTVGPGAGQKMVVLSPGEKGPGPSGGDPGGADRQGADGHEQGGKDWGIGHDPNLAGAKPTNPKMGTIDVEATGEDTGQGATRSQAIVGAGQRGFRGAAYRRVYGEYRTTAEQHIHKDRIPPGANERVRRYFDLIRPRE
jgi:hypothetical protein